MSITHNSDQPEKPAESDLGLRERQKEKRRRGILTNAVRLIRKNGFEATTIAEIAEAAEVSPATVFNYFGTKEDILLELIIEEHRDWMHLVSNLEISSKTSVLDQLCAFFITITRSALDHLDRTTWRHIEASRIRNPDSPIAQRHEGQVVAGMRAQLSAFLQKVVDARRAPAALAREGIATIIYSYWGDQFIELIIDEAMTLEDHESTLRTNLGELLSAFEGSDTSRSI